MKLEQIVNKPNLDINVLCDYATQVTFLAPKLYRCNYVERCIFQTTFYYRYCVKELDREKELK